MSSLNPTNASYENSTWAEDWSANLDSDTYLQSLPKGVNTINIFVGQLDMVNGVPTIDGFVQGVGNDPKGAFPNQAALIDFISKCKAQGITVKLSIGGQQGTAYGESWNNLTSSNVSAYAQALVDFCHTTGAAGIDFDFELDGSNAQAALAGKLAGQFKDLDPSLQASFCVFSGIGSQGPTHSVDSIFLQNAVTSTGASAIDRIYVMSYWQGPGEVQQNETYLLEWKNWLQENYKMSPSQISCGMDPSDPNESYQSGDLAQWVEFAKENGFSTAIFDNSGVGDYVNGNGQGENWGQVVQSLYQG